MKFKSSRFFFLTSAISMLPLYPASLALAQSSATIAVPNGPLLAPPPEFSHWVETFSYPEERAVKTGAAPIFETQTRTIDTTKTKKIVCEETTSAQGEKRVDWYIGTTQYSKLPSAPGWFLGAVGLTSPAGGFSNLDWVVAANYIGTAKLSGKSCFVFSSTHPNQVTASVGEQILSNVEALPTVAYIDAETRLPVQVRQYGIIRTFQFKEPPTQMLAPPPDLAQDLKKAEDSRARFSRPLQDN